MENKILLLEKKGPITIMTLNRPQKLNAMSKELLIGIGEAVKKVGNDKKCKALIITGAGGKAFCAGDDIAFLDTMKSEKDAVEFVNRLQTILSSIEDLDKLVIAAIDGYCLGGGCQLAMSCDIRIATPNSKFGLPEIKLGLLPGGGGTYRLISLVGMGKAKELILIGNQIDAHEARSIGLLNRITKDKDSLMKEAMELALSTTTNSFNAIKQGKKVLNANVPRLNDVERESFISSFKHKDSKEGLRAFLEKRKPNFE